MFLLQVLCLPWGSCLQVCLECPECQDLCRPHSSIPQCRWWPRWWWDMLSYKIKLYRPHCNLQVVCGGSELLPCSDYDCCVPLCFLLICLLWLSLSFDGSLWFLVCEDKAAGGCWMVRAQDNGWKIVLLQQQNSWVCLGEAKSSHRLGRYELRLFCIWFVHKMLLNGFLHCFFDTQS